MFDDPGGPILGAHRTLLYAPLGSFFQKPNEKGLPMKGSNFQIIYQKETQWWLVRSILLAWAVLLDRSKFCVALLSVVLVVSLTNCCTSQKQVVNRKGKTCKNIFFHFLKWSYLPCFSKFLFWTNLGHHSKLKNLGHFRGSEKRKN